MEVRGQCPPGPCPYAEQIHSLMPQPKCPPQHEGNGGHKRGTPQKPYRQVNKHGYAEKKFTFLMVREAGCESAKLTVTTCRQVGIFGYIIDQKD
jgi:hypothetical protein